MRHNNSEQKRFKQQQQGIATWSGHRFSFTYSHPLADKHKLAQTHIPLPSSDIITFHSYESFTTKYVQNEILNHLYVKLNHCKSVELNVNLTLFLSPKQFTMSIE